MRLAVPAFPMPQRAETDAELGRECPLHHGSRGSGIASKVNAVRCIAAQGVAIHEPRDIEEETMRAIRICTAAALLCLLTLSSPGWAMEDPVTATPDVYKVLHENEQIRVLEVTYQAGQRENWHGHPRYLVYVVDPGEGKIRIENDKGELHEYDLKAGQHLLTGPVEKHRGTNPGSVPIRVLAIELKQER